MKVEIKYDIGQVVYYLTHDYCRTGLEVKAVKIKSITINKYDGDYYIVYQVVDLNNEHMLFNTSNITADERDLFANKQELKQALNKIADSLLKTKQLTEKGLPEID